MQAGKTTVGALFQVEARVVAPLYQRPYVWSEREWEALWTAIAWTAEQQLSTGSARPYFLGAMVLEQLRVPTARISARQIIDGQQRLVTLQLCLAALRDLCRDRGLEAYAGLLSRMTANESPVIASEEERFKVWPTNRDQDAFRSAITAGSSDAVRRAAATARRDGRIPAAYLYLTAQAQEWLSASSDVETRMAALWDALTNRLLVVAIDLDPEDDPQQIFETLNALGAQLLPADLVKNFLLREAERERLDTQHLYRRYWEAFDQDEGYWREKVRQGRLTRPRIDLFLQHYLTLRARREVLAMNLFGEFRSLARESGESVSLQLESFRNYAEIYRQFDAADGQFRPFFRRIIEDLDTTTVLPLLLAVLRRYADEPAQVQAVLVDLESYLVRRAICGLTSKAYNRIFVSLVQRLASVDDFSAERIREFLLEQEGESSRWPADAELEYRWLTEPVYRTQRQGRLRMLLERLEQAMRSPKTEDIVFKKPLTIEHLMPREWERYWPLDGANPLEAKRRRDALVHTVGNLTLLTQPLNAEVSNGPWRLKKPAIEQYSLLRMNEGWPDVWSEDQIQARGRALFIYARRIWSRPHVPRDERVWQPPLESTPVPVPTGDLSTTRALELAFWEGFAAYYAERASPLAVRTPKAHNWLNFPLGRAGFQVSTKVNTDHGWIACEIKIQRRDAKRAFELLHAERDEIEREIGVQLDWQLLPDRQRCRITQTRPADINRRDEWPAYFAWLRERAETFTRTFAPRVESLQL